jgi:TetR/AcrR family transcriptional regulator, regulator of autoinduction and epiphytic fitness
VAVDPSAIDGRSARALRTREAIVDALLALIDDGELKPPAPRIAERAGVSLRSIYQHFEDLEALFAAAHRRYTERLLAIAAEVPDTGSLESRLDAFVEQRARIMEAVTPARRASLLQEPFSQQLRDGRNRIYELATAETVRVFRAELAGLDEECRADLVAAASMAASWEAWEHLRLGGLDVDGARRVMRMTLSALLGASR